MKTATSKSRKGLATIYGALLLIASLGCIDGATTPEGGGDASVSGNIQGRSFSAATAIAEVDSSSSYFITLADSPDYTCSSTPFGDYITLVLGPVTAEGSYDAVDNVTINIQENSANTAVPVTSGTVTITDIDEFGEVIRGQVSAETSDSSISGSFTAVVCE